MVMALEVMRYILENQTQWKIVLKKLKQPIQMLMVSQWCIPVLKQQMTHIAAIVLLSLIWMIGMILKDIVHVFLILVMRFFKMLKSFSMNCNDALTVRERLPKYDQITNGLSLSFISKLKITYYFILINVM